MLLVSVMQLQLASATGALLSGSNSNTDTDNTDTDSSLSLGNDFDTDWYYLRNVNKDEERESRDLFNPKDEKPFLKRLQRYYWIKRSSNRVVKKIKPLELNGYSIDINIKQFRSPRRCHYNEICKNRYKQAFECVCPKSTLCVGQGSHFEAKCSNNLAPYVWVQDFDDDNNNFADNSRNRFD